MRLIQLTKDTFYFDLPSSVGLYLLNSHDCCLIDSGEKLEQVREMGDFLHNLGYEVKAILSTHFHPDHSFGHGWWQQHSNCDIYASLFDAAFLENPNLSPYSLYSAHPLRVLNNRYLLAPGCQVTHRVESGVQTIAGKEFIALSLPGHTPGHLGWVTPDQVLFAGDALLAPHILKTAKLNYTADVSKHINTLGCLQLSSYSPVIVSHGGQLDNLHDAVLINQQAMYAILNFIRALLAERSLSIEDTLAALVNEFGLPLNNSQYFLYRATVSAYLAYLCEERAAFIHLNQGRMFFTSNR